MDLPTPTFGSEFFPLKGTCRFSDVCFNNKKPNKKKIVFSNSMNIKNSKHKLKNSTKKKEHSCKKSRSRSKSSKIKRHKCKSIKGNKDNQNFEKYNENVNNFIKNHRFELRDDFNEKNVNKFLSSKEAAFEMPIILTQEIILEY